MNASQHADFHREVLADIAAYEEKLGKLRDIAEYHAAKSNIQDSSNPAIPQREAEKRAAADHSGEFAKLPQIKAVQAVLQEAGEPLRTAEIVNRMVTGGFPTKDAARTKMSIFTSMTRKDDIFTKTGPGVWTLIATNSEPETE